MTLDAKLRLKIPVIGPYIYIHKHGTCEIPAIIIYVCSRKSSPSAKYAMYTWGVAMKSEYCFVISIVLDNLSLSFLHIYHHHINLPLYPVEKKFGKIAHIWSWFPRPRIKNSLCCNYKLNCALPFCRWNIFLWSNLNLFQRAFFNMLEFSTTTMYHLHFCTPAAPPSVSKCSPVVSSRS